MTLLTLAAAIAVCVYLISKIKEHHGLPWLR